LGSMRFERLRRLVSGLKSIFNSMFHKFPSKKSPKFHSSIKSSPPQFNDRNFTKQFTSNTLHLLFSALVIKPQRKTFFCQVSQSLFSGMIECLKLQRDACLLQDKKEKRYPNMHRAIINGCFHLRR
jgi:hypothetical protein